MKHFKQHALKPLLTIVALLCVGFSSFAWDTYKIVNTSDANAELATLSWNSNLNCLEGTIPSGKNGKQFSITATTGTTTFWYGCGSTSNNVEVGTSKQESVLSQGSWSFKLTTNDEVKVKVYTNNNQNNSDPVKIEFNPSTTNNGAHPLYIGFSNDSYSYKEITSSGDTYNNYTFTTNGIVYFRFYNGNTGNVAWAGPEINEQEISSNGTTVYSTKGNDHVFKISNAGTYTIKVSEFDGTNVLKFTVSGESHSATETEYTIYFYDKNNNGAWRDIYAYVFNPEYKNWQDKDKIESTGQYVFEDGNYYPAYKYDFSWNQNPKNIKFMYFGGVETGNFDFANGGWYNNSGKCDDSKTLVDKEKLYKYVSLVEENGDRCYNLSWNGSYFAGKIPGGNDEMFFKVVASKNEDLSNPSYFGYGTGDDHYWLNKTANNPALSKDLNSIRLSINDECYVRVYVNDDDVDNHPNKLELFEPDPYYFIGDLNQWFSKEFTVANASRGIDAEMLAANKEKWKFKYDVTDGWYKFTDFPKALLAGQFQIFDGVSWNDNGTYSHGVRINIDNTNWDDNFTNYFSKPLTLDTEVELRHGQGQNLHLPCNAVKDAEIWFKPAEGSTPGKMIVTGTMVDYYIFYDRSGDIKHSGLRAHINSAKPNANNYYIPYNKVDNFTCKNIGEDPTNHMNYNDGHDYDANGYKMLRASFEGLSEAQLKEKLPNAEESLIKSLSQNGTLPNGVSVAGRNIWYAKIPNGFEYPAGTKFAVAFRNSLDDNSWNGKATDSDKTPLWTPVSTNNLYFFDGVHVHMNSEDIELKHGVNVEIEYRIYTYDSNYNTVVLSEDENGNVTYPVIATSGNVPSSNDEQGWVELDTDHVSHSIWGLNEYSFGGKNTWRVKTVENGNADKRKEIPAGLANAYVQFRISYTAKNSSNAPAKAASQDDDNKAWVVVFPDYPTIGHDENEVKLEGNDYYRVLADTDDVVTGIEEIFDNEDWSDEANGETAEPVYYNLQGVRVANPAKGLYIKVTGSKSEKVLF